MAEPFTTYKPVSYTHLDVYKRQAMLSVELDGLTGKAKWTEDGECDKEPKAFEIQDGAYVEME